MMKELPRDQALRLFDPHMKSFTCEIEAQKVPPIDAQANAWFLQARALEDPEPTLEERNPDYKEIVRLTRQAAERHHWKAMLNLASLHLEGHDPDYGPGSAVKLVEAAMQLGIPAAFDRMGTYYMNGTWVKQDATRAYAFWQRAAEMGNPQAMAFLGKKLKATWDSPKDGFWANIPVATKMLECALGQGEGKAAYALHFIYRYSSSPTGNPNGEPTRETRTRAFRVLHEGVKLGCEDCANKLAIEFESPRELSNMLAPYIDKARAERYDVLADALGFWPNRRYPNLDKVLPLPPMDLPPWNGDKTVLINAAMGVAPLPPVPKPSTASKRTGRHHLDAAFDRRKTGLMTSEPRAPFGGYWLPASDQQAESLRKQLIGIEPAQYLQGEDFRQFCIHEGQPFGAIACLSWEHWKTVPHDCDAVRPHAAAGLVREVARPEPLRGSPGRSPCPVTGTWQPWVHSEHPLQATVNQYWRQTWLLAGQAFPDPQRDWLLPLTEGDVTWHLMDASPVDLLAKQIASDVLERFA